MNVVTSIARALLLAGFSFVAGWLIHEREASARLTRMTEERDLATQMASAAVSMSEKALEHSLSNADTLAICLGRLNLRPAEVTPRLTTGGRAGLAWRAFH